MSSWVRGTLVTGVMLFVLKRWLYIGKGNCPFFHSPRGLTLGKESDFPFLVRRNFIQLCIHTHAVNMHFGLFYLIELT